MPVLPYLYFIFTFVSKEYFFLLIFKNILISFLFIYCLKIFYKKFIQKSQKKFYLINFFLLIIFFFPSVIKHASNISYEEGIILVINFMVIIFFTL